MHHQEEGEPVRQRLRNGIGHTAFEVRTKSVLLIGVVVSPGCERFRQRGLTFRRRASALRISEERAHLDAFGGDGEKRAGP